MNKTELMDHIYSLAYVPVYEKDFFDIEVAEGIFINFVSSENPKKKVLFTAKTYYDNVVDIAKKIRISVASAVGQCDAAFDDSLYNPFDKPTKDEIVASYCAENVLFRVLILWDILAQLYNVINECNIPEDKINYHRFFHNLAQSNDSFAQKVYRYLSEETLENDPASGVFDKAMSGNHKFLVKTRNSFAHRYSPNVTVILRSETRLRIPAYVLFRRALEDYCVVSELLHELFSKVHDEYLQNREAFDELDLLNHNKENPPTGDFVII